MQRVLKRPRLRNECVDWRFDIGPVQRDAFLNPSRKIGVFPTDASKATNKS